MDDAKKKKLTDITFRVTEFKKGGSCVFSQRGTFGLEEVPFTSADQDRLLAEQKKSPGRYNDEMEIVRQGLAVVYDTVMLLNGIPIDPKKRKESIHDGVEYYAKCRALTEMKYRSEVWDIVSTNYGVDVFFGITKDS